jgi:hypothetical protein
MDDGRIPEAFVVARETGGLLHQCYALHVHATSMPVMLGGTLFITCCTRFCFPMTVKIWVNQRQLSAAKKLHSLMLIRRALNATRKPLPNSNASGERLLETTMSLTFI